MPQAKLRRSRLQKNKVLSDRLEPKPLKLLLGYIMVRSISFLVLISNIAFGQISLESRTTLEENFKGSNNYIYTSSKSFEGIKGHPYLFEQWSMGSFLLADSSMFDNLELKYDIFNELLVVKDPVSGREVVPDPMTVLHFKIADREFVQLFPEDGSLEKERYWENIYSGKSFLFKHISKYMKEADYKGAYSSNKAYDELVENKPVYLYSGEQYIQVKLSKKGFQKLFEDNDNALEYIKKEKLNFKNENSAIRLLTYLDSL